jgi:hypothetical protein
MLSWKLWRTLYDVPLRWRLRKVLMPESLFEKFGALELASFGMLIWICACGILPFILIPATITYFGMRLAWTTASMLARQHEFGRFDTFAATALGSLEMMLEVGRICFKPMIQSALNLLFTALALVTVFLLFLSLLGRSLNLVIAGGFVVIVVALIAYFDYRQTFIASFLVGVLAGTMRERTVAWLTVFAGCVTMQFSIYGVTYLQFSLWINHSPRTTDGTEYLWLFLGVVVPLVVSYLLREALIMILWRAVKTRLNDDIPALKPV